MASHWFRGEFMQLLGCSQTLEAAHNHSNVAGKDRVKEETGSLPTPTHPPLHNLSLPPNPQPPPPPECAVSHLYFGERSRFYIFKNTTGARTQLPEVRERQEPKRRADAEPRGEEREGETEKRDRKRDRERGSLQATQKQAPVSAWS